MPAVRVVICALSPAAASPALFSTEPSPRWHLTPNGAITWEVTPGDSHRDFIEMDGEAVAQVIRYGVEADGAFSVNSDVVWPSLRFKPNDTDSHLRESFGEDVSLERDARFRRDAFPVVRIRLGQEWWPVSAHILVETSLSGVACFKGRLQSRDGTSRLGFRRTIFPSIDKPAAIDRTEITNTSSDSVDISVDDYEETSKTSTAIGMYGEYRLVRRVLGRGTLELRPGESTTVDVIEEAHRANEPLLSLDVPAEKLARVNRVKAIADRLVLETPDPTLDAAFRFAKVHAAESIFRTDAGLLHSPGGGTRYYAAIWANDEAEYANPFFGMLGDPAATAASVNSFRLFARYMNAAYLPIPSSIVGEGKNFWNGAGDRGDMAMIAYGAGRFALANGDPQVAESLWPLIEWCLEYIKRHVTSAGVVASDTDELEGRLPAGRSNLNTASLYYDALRSADYLGKELGKAPSQLREYEKRARSVRAAIERYFGATVAGFETYRYYDKRDLAEDPAPDVVAYAHRPDPLRAWIATPLVVGIFDRRLGTIDALFSQRLWTVDGLLSEEGQPVVWDRSTLYALRGVLAAGDTERGLQHLSSYSARRLLGDHVPYPYEAFPEGGKAQLAAESALYCRIYTEGLFGIRPTGLRSFSIAPRLPAQWSSMALRNVHAFGHAFDLDVSRAGPGRIAVRVIEPLRQKRYQIDSGERIAIDLGP